MQGEVGGEYGFLERGELRAGEGAVGGYAADEGLEECGAEEGAIARSIRVSNWACKVVHSVGTSGCDMLRGT